LIAAQDYVRATPLIENALRIWREETFLAGLTGPWAEAVRLQLAEEHRSAFLDYCDIKLRMGHHRELIPQLRLMQGKNQFDEALTYRLMLAYYRSGRTAMALEAFHQTRRELLTELGVDPGRGLTELHSRILRQDPEIDADPPD
ncbi:AfsR/SARP family transcriptional regulator, partial [Nonomuraea fuscirosea]